MNVLIIILVVIGIIIAVFLIVALFAKKEYAIAREITITKPKGEVFNYVKLLKNQDLYSKWVMTDPNKKKVFTGTDGTVGFVYAWDGNSKAGKGEQEIKHLKEEERIDMEIRFERPFKSVAQIYMTTENAADRDQTKVKWGFIGKNKYPLNVMNLFMSSMLGKDMETSLTKLKNNLEDNK